MVFTARPAAPLAGFSLGCLAGREGKLCADAAGASARSDDMTLEEDLTVTRSVLGVRRGGGIIFFIFLKTHRAFSWANKLARLLSLEGQSHLTPGIDNMAPMWGN